jgi:hypothetical protein
VKPAPKLPPQAIGWKPWWEILHQHMVAAGGSLTGADIDTLVKTRVLHANHLVHWAGKQSMSDMLVDPSSQHVVRLHTLVHLGVLIRHVKGKTPDRVYYSLPKPRKP